MQTFFYKILLYIFLFFPPFAMSLLEMICVLLTFISQESCKTFISKLGTKTSNLHVSLLRCMRGDCYCVYLHYTPCSLPLVAHSTHISHLQPFNVNMSLKFCLSLQWVPADAYGMVAQDVWCFLFSLQGKRKWIWESVSMDLLLW